MKKTIAIILAGLLGLSSVTVFAAEKKQVPAFKKADTDKSKSIDEAEFKAATEGTPVKKTFQDLDKDKDGKLSMKEYSVIVSEDCE